MWLERKPFDNYRFDDKVAIITGTGVSTSIGYATAMILAQRGAFAICVDITQTCEKTKEDITTAGGKAMASRTDVTNSAAVKKMIEESVRKLGKVDILVNNVGGTLGHPHDPHIEDVKEEDWNKILAVNLNGAYNCCRYVVPGMRQRKYGRIVNISSGAGIAYSRTGVHPYAAAKAGLMGFSRQLAKELGPIGITVNCVAPGFTETRANEQEKAYHERARLSETVALGRVASPIEIAYAICWLASNEASYVTGQTLIVDGGQWMR